MKFGVDPLLLPWLLLPAAAVYFGLVLWFYWRWRRFVSRRYWQALLGTKLLSMLMLFLLLLNPYYTLREPDTRKYSVAFLIDATGSMATADCDGRRRLDVVRQEVLAPTSDFSTDVISRFPQARFYIFAGDRLRRIEPTAAFDTLPGDTDIDPVLKQTFKSGSGQLALGAVVLISDGGDNRGVSLVEGATPFRQAGIPVHCIGVGEARPKPDIAVHWVDVPTTAVKAKAIQLTARVERRATDIGEVELTLYAGTREIARQTASFEAGRTRRTVDFETRSYQTGFHTYRIAAAPLPREENQLNNIDLAGIRVRDPDTFKVFYFSGNLDWNYKFLKILADDQERLQLDAVIRTGPTSWFSRGFPQDPPVDGFPAAEILGQFDALILTLDSLQLLDAEQLEGLLNFVENRGGGVALTGVTDKLPEEIRKALPFRSQTFQVSRLGATKLAFRPSPVLSRGRGEELQEFADRLYVPAESAFLEIRKRDLKPGARAVATMKGPEFIALTAQNYGAGKVAYLNIDDTWKWAIRTDAGNENYGLFWGRLISWVASSSRERLTIKPQGAKLPLEQEQRLTVDVLSKNFVAANNARVTAVITVPDGTEENLTLFGSARVDGRYETKFVPRQPGEYVVRIFARLADGEVLERTATYLAPAASAENQPAPMAEPQLQSLARLTNGNYWNYRNIDRIRELPLTKELQYIESRRDFRHGWLFLILIIACVLPDWILRRRIGLR